MTNRKPGAFTKNDPRINRKGRPKNFDALRKLALQISNETVKNEDGEPVLVDGKPVTAIELLLKHWLNSMHPALQMKFVEIAFGKVPDTEPTSDNDTWWKATDDEGEGV